MTATPAVISPRYTLSLVSYPKSTSSVEACQVIYNNQDKNLVAAMTSLPYTVGRSFGATEIEELGNALQELKIGYVFKGLNPEWGEIKYDPKATEAPVTEPIAIEEVRSAKMKLNLAAVLYAVGTIAVLGGAFFYFNGVDFKKDASPVVESTQTTPVVVDTGDAKVVHLKNKSEYRSSKDFSWSKLNLEQSLFFKDSLRTFDDALAIIQYKDGGRVSVKANTLLVIGVPAETQEKVINLEEGRITAKLQPSTSPSKLIIKTPRGMVEIPAPAANESQAETTVTKDAVSIAVTEGTAILKQKNSEQPIVIQQAQKITVTPTAVSTPQPFIGKLSLVSPEAGSKLSVDPNDSQSIIFKWEPFNNATNYQWRLAADPQMNSVLLEQSVAEPMVEVRYLDLGTLYWSVQTEIDGFTVESPIWQLHVDKR